MGAIPVRPVHCGGNPSRHGPQRPGDYARYHEALNRAVWSPREVARMLLLLLLQYLDRGDGPWIFGIVEWTVTAVAWYDGTTRAVELVSQTAVWYRAAGCLSIRLSSVVQCDVKGISFASGIRPAIRTLQVRTKISRFENRPQNAPVIVPF